MQDQQLVMEMRRRKKRQLAESKWLYQGLKWGLMVNVFCSRDIAPERLEVAPSSSLYHLQLEAMQSLIV